VAFDFSPTFFVALFFTRLFTRAIVSYRLDSGSDSYLYSYSFVGLGYSYSYSYSYSALTSAAAPAAAVAFAALVIVILGARYTIMFVWPYTRSLAYIAVVAPVVVAVV